MKFPLPEVIDDLWEQRSGPGPEDTAARAEVVAAVDEIDAGNGGEFGMPCLLMLRRLPEGSRPDKTELNAILRDHGIDG